MSFATTQDAYKELVTVYLSPALRDMGFRGSGGKYQLPSESHWSLIELQKSAFGDRSDMTFTLNLFVVPRDSWMQTGKRVSIQGLRPESGTYRDGFERARLGMLAGSDDRDHWWSLQPDTDLAALSRTVLTDLERVGMPWMIARMTAFQ